MNKLNTEQRNRIVAALVEGNSLRSVTRMTGVHRTTVMKLLCDLVVPAPIIRTKRFAIFDQSASSAMKSGALFTPRKKTAQPRINRRVRATFGHGLRSTLIRNSFPAGSSASVTRVARITSCTI